ncbi:SH3 domain-containing protein [Jiella mangrovi]|uniref:SH3 domain-containing protein n=1 Tax=Jiella mangrovi TaxID=2821407 RepID=A0ABS4BHI1_9HYPH|nr:SH3 domain-containing protein [Jiella mangrovi]MBP0616027.1 SH3 domain-containing protein [Jiella mangrovi]
MKKTLSAAAVLAGVVALPVASAHASERAIATTNVNLRAGPSTQYPVVDVLVAGEQLRLFGCLSTRSWCDVRFRGQRGWISANYIALTGGNYSGRHAFDPYTAPVITFSVDSYWGAHYSKRDFYRNRDRYDRGRGPDWRDGDRGRDRRGRDADRGRDRDRDRDRDRRHDRGDRDHDRRDNADRGPDRGFGALARDAERRGEDARRRGDRDDRGARRMRDNDRGDRGDRGDRRRGEDGRPPVPLYRVD